MVRTMAEKVDALVVSVEYRLAPEHPYPAALDDCYAALQWLVARDDIDSQRIVVAGVSAGAGLAAALTLRCVDSRLVDLAGQALICPMLDDRTVRRTTVAGARGWTPEDNAFGWRSYLGSEPGIEGVSAYAAPARRENLSGLPPAWVTVGTADLFHDEVVHYATGFSQQEYPPDLRSSPAHFTGLRSPRPTPPLHDSSPQPATPQYVDSLRCNRHRCGDTTAKPFTPLACGRALRA